MPMYELDVTHASDEDDFTQIVELDGVRYLLRFAWNTRDTAWRLSVYQPDGTPLALSRKLVTNVSLLRGEIDTRLQPGMLLIVDTTEANDADPDHDGLGDRWLLAYYDATFLATGQ